MSDRTDIDRVRSEALDRIERSERSFRLALLAAAALEALFLIMFLFAMERNNRLHLLLFLATVGSYSIVILGLVALGAYINQSVLRVLKAIDLLKGLPGDRDDG